MKLFKKLQETRLSYKERNRKHKINENIEEMNLQFLLMNTQTITATKVQAVVEEFMQGQTHTSIFSFTKTKVDSINFKPVGLKIFTKHRRFREKKGGGLMIGFKDDKKKTEGRNKNK